MLIREWVTPDKPILLLSLHPGPFDQIVQQHKVLEFRKRFFDRPFQAFVCLTGPAGGVGLFLDVGQPIVAPPADLISLGMAVQTDRETDLRTYFGTTPTGTALPILRAARLELLPRPILRAEFPGFTAPRSYAFLDGAAKRPLLETLASQPVRTQWTFDWSPWAAEIRKIQQNT